jgi:hypothetical protein
MANYMSRSSFSYCALHLEGEEFFWYAKQPADYLLSVENDYHDPSRVNFFRPWIIVPTVQPNVVENVGM